MHISGAGWSSLVARRAHNPKVVGSNPAPATTEINKNETTRLKRVFLCLKFDECGDLAYRIKIIFTA